VFAAGEEFGAFCGARAPPNDGVLDDIGSGGGGGGDGVGVIGGNGGGNEVLVKERATSSMGAP